MKRFKRVMMAVAVAACLSGCATTPPTQVIDDHMTLPQLPTVWITATTVSPPPDPVTYATADPQAKEDQLTTAWRLQTSNLQSCNDDKVGISSWWTQQTAVISQANAATSASAPTAARAP